MNELEKLKAQRDFHMREHDKEEAERKRLQAALEHIAKTRGRNGHTATAIVQYVREVLGDA